MMKNYNIIIKEEISNEVNSGMIVVNKKENILKFFFEEKEYILEIKNKKNIRLTKKSDIIYDINLIENEITENLIVYGNLKFKINIYTSKINLTEEKIYLKYDIFEENIEDKISIYEIILSL